jgi:hypothetical protein
LKQTGIKLSVILAAILIAAGVVAVNSIVQFVPKQVSFMISQDESNYYLTNRDTG